MQESSKFLRISGFVGVAEVFSKNKHQQLLAMAETGCYQNWIHQAKCSSWVEFRLIWLLTSKLALLSYTLGQNQNQISSVMGRELTGLQ